MFLSIFAYINYLFQVKLGAVIGLSNATAIGTFDNISTEQQRLSVTESQAIEGMLTFEESEPKKVKFKEDDKMISHFDDTDLWAHGNVLM